MKKLLMIAVAGLISACTFYPLGMSEMEWNSLSKTEKIQARREEAKLREQRQVRHAIERQNRLKERRVVSDNNLSSSTAQAASAAASAAKSASLSASAAQQASENTSTNNINFNPNIVVSNTNQNDLANVSENTNSQAQDNNQTQANSNDSNANNASTLNNSAIAKAKAKANAGKRCYKYHKFMKKAKKAMTDDKFEEAVKFYKKAIHRACTKKQSKLAKTNLKSAKAKVNTVCKQHYDFLGKGDAFVAEAKFHQAVQMYEKAVEFACTDEQKTIAQEKLTSAKEDLENSNSGNNGGN
ncbi:MAG: hypothetical protein ACTSXL_03040 [Alphaproteobacteria bacterium]|nr:MAG: hypothetical protein B6I23_00735 [Rickettsiaceae bacterium 4572_127]